MVKNFEGVPYWTFPIADALGAGVVEEVVDFVEEDDIKVDRVLAVFEVEDELAALLSTYMLHIYEDI